MRVQIGGQWYPLKLEEIACILPNPRVTPVPKAPPGVAGLVLYQGQVVPCLLYTSCLHRPSKLNNT